MMAAETEISPQRIKGLSSIKEIDPYAAISDMCISQATARANNSIWLMSISAAFLSLRRIGGISFLTCLDCTIAF